jgi:RDD family
MMPANLLLGVVLLPALVFALAYKPMFDKLSLGLVSPYAKADLARRFSAVTIDGLLLVATLMLYRGTDSVWFLAGGAAYLLLRDAAWGRSVGKFSFGLVVIDLRTGRPCTSVASVNRNVLLLLPGANVVGAFLEAATIVRDPQGQRLGDRIAHTQVVEGFGVKDVVPAVQAWWLDVFAQLDGNPRRKPQEVDR